MEKAAYKLDDQIGFILRKVTQKHLAIFSESIPELTTTQFAVLARLKEMGPLSQNHLGRETAMDAATIKGVVDRLGRQGLVATTPDQDDKRRLTVALTAKGDSLFIERVSAALSVSEETLAPLTPQERRVLTELLSKLT